MDDELLERAVCSRTVFEGRLLTVRQDEVQLADGSRARREVVQHPGAVAVLALTRDDHVVMIRQYRHAAGEVLLELPAGLLEPRETLAACARRELMEETGYSAARLEPLLSVFPSPGFSSEIIHIFLAQCLAHSAQATEPDERIAVCLVPFGEAVRMAMQGKVRNGTAALGLLALAAQRNSER